MKLWEMVWKTGDFQVSSVSFSRGVNNKTTKTWFNMLQIHYMNVVKQFSSKYTKQNASNLSAARKTDKFHQWDVLTPIVA